MFALAINALKSQWAAGLFGAALSVAPATQLLSRSRNQA
jgi:hypothetical protein